MLKEGRSELKRRYEEEIGKGKKWVEDLVREGLCKTVKEKRKVT